MNGQNAQKWGRKVIDNDRIPREFKRSLRRALRRANKALCK